jgi:hypothetical protein
MAYRIGMVEWWRTGRKKNGAQGLVCSFCHTTFIVENETL